jgi:hypothetical protein|tara:strand:- start:193 stop:459 length:267 start_codon:yes stop_codon:yes gene_type:complete
MPITTLDKYNNDIVARNMTSQGTYVMAHIPKDCAGVVYQRNGDDKKMSTPQLRWLRDWCEREIEVIADPTAIHSKRRKRERERQGIFV